MREIIVKIPDTAYEGILNADKVNGNWGKDLLGILCNAIANGTPLPKGHGRLIYADDIALIDERFYIPSDYYVAESAINDAPTIIEGTEE